MLFCPFCVNILSVLKNELTFNILACSTCDYKREIDIEITETVKYTRNKEEKILDEDKEWKHADTTETICPRCHHTKAFYIQMQTRSGDEGSTLFYKCSGCKHTWKES